MKKVLAILSLLFNFPSYGQIAFTDSTTLLGLPIHTSAFLTIGVVDMNNDYLDDIVRIRNNNQLSIEYQNQNGSFINISLGIVTNLNPYSICVADVDKNGFNDIFLGAEDSTMIFYADSVGLSFSKVYLPGSFYSQGANFIDIDNDSWVDLFVCNDDSSNYTYTNDGLGNFIIDTSLILGSFSGNYGSIWSDFDNDGDADLYISKCKNGATSPIDPRRLNNLFRNDGAGVFTEIAFLAGVEDGAQSWAADFGDIDNDGDFDLAVIDMYEENKLYENLGNGVFSDISSSSGIDTFDYLQVKFSDLDNDGFIDLIIGANTKLGGHGRVYKNNGNKTFTLINNALPDTLTDRVGSFAIGDLNQDGFLDILAIGIGSDRLLLNTGNLNNYLMINLIGDVSNINAIGARVEIYGPWGIQIREVRSGEGYGIMNSFTQHFGLGANNQADSLIVRWPSGIIDKASNISANQFLVINEGQLSGIYTSPNISKTSIYPNPFSRSTIIEFENSIGEKHALTVYDYRGEIVHTISNITTEQVLIERNNLSRGLYFFQLRNSRGIVDIGKLIIY